MGVVGESGSAGFEPDASVVGVVGESGSAGFEPDASSDRAAAPSADPGTEGLVGLSGQDRPVGDRVAGPDPAGAAAASDSQLLLEIVEPEERGLAAQPGVRQESPLELTEPDEPDGSSGLVSAEGGVYTWEDGDRTLEVRLQLDLVVVDDGSVASVDDVVVDTVNGLVVRVPGAGAGFSGGESGDPGDPGGGLRSAGTGAAQPVFRSGSGRLMTLPGDIAVVLDPEWNTAEVAAFFARNGIDRSRVSELDFLANGFVVETDPGFPALDLANALAGQSGVELSSPNWWTEYTTR